MGNWELPGFTYLWMFPIYGLAVFEKIHDRIRAPYGQRSNLDHNHFRSRVPERLAPFGIAGTLSLGLYRTTPYHIEVSSAWIMLLSGFWQGYSLKGTLVSRHFGCQCLALDKEKGYYLICSLALRR